MSESKIFFFLNIVIYAILSLLLKWNHNLEKTSVKSYVFASLHVERGLSFSYAMVCATFNIQRSL